MRAGVHRCVEEDPCGSEKTLTRMQYGGISSDTCSTFPTALQPGCDFRFGDFFENADNPTVDYVQVTCPKALTDKTGCIRAGETPTGSDSSSSSSAAAASTSSTTAASSFSTIVSTTSEAAPTSTSATASEPAYSAPASSSPEAAPTTASSSSVVSSPYSSSAGTGSTSVVAPIGTGTAASSGYASAPSGSAPGDDSCEVQYQYVYDL